MANNNHLVARKKESRREEQRKENYLSFSVSVPRMLFGLRET